MKRIIFVLITAVSLSQIQAQTPWTVDQAHSSIDFSVSHLLISEVSGNFKTFEITATSSEKFENPTFTATIEAASIDTNNSMRDDHLKASDFFDVENHRTITFKSTSFKQIDDKKFELTGNITIKGITKSITFTGKLNGVIKDPRSGKTKAGLKLTTDLDREQFNIGEGTSSIGNDIEIVIRLEMNKQ